MNMYHENLTNKTSYQQGVRNNVVGKDKGYGNWQKGWTGGIYYDFLYSSDFQNQVNISYIQKSLYVIKMGGGGTQTEANEFNCISKKYHNLY